MAYERKGGKAKSLKREVPWMSINWSASSAERLAMPVKNLRLSRRISGSKKEKEKKKDNRKMHRDERTGEKSSGQKGRQEKGGKGELSEGQWALLKRPRSGGT